MKKLSKLLLVGILATTLTGCGEDVVETKTCSKQNKDYHETYVLTATNDEIEKVELKFVYENSMFGLDTLANLDDATKETIKTSMLKTLGLDSSSYEGFEVNIDIQDQMTVTIKADLTTADAEIMKKVGLDFANTDMSLKRAVSDLEDSGSVCE